MRGVAKIGSWRRAAIGKVSGLLAAMRTGGCGVCTGLGITVRSRARKYLPSNENASRVQAARMKIEGFLEALPDLFLRDVVSGVVNGRRAPTHTVLRQT